jgi:hypothetical protein
VRQLAGIGVSANAHRIDDDVVTKAEKLRHYLAVLGDSPDDPSADSLDDAAVRFRASVSTLRNWLRLHRCAAEVKAAVRSGNLTLRAALPLADLPPPLQVSTMQEILASGTSGAAAIDAARLARDIAQGAVVLPAGDAADDEGEGEGEAWAEDADPRPARGGTVTADEPDDADEPAATRERKASTRPPTERSTAITAAVAKRILALATSDRESGHGAGTSLPPEAYAMLRVLCGDLTPRRVSGMSELLSRAMAGEKPASSKGK